jgi:hypothetical protein
MPEIYHGLLGCTLKTEAGCSWEPLVTTYQTTDRRNQEGHVTVLTGMMAAPVYVCVKCKV